MGKAVDHGQDNELTAASAKLFIADQDRKRALKAIAEERRRLDRAETSAKKAKLRFEKTIAAAVTSDATKVDWYNRPGPLPADQVREHAKLDSVQLHRIMERRRKEAGKKKGRNR